MTSLLLADAEAPSASDAPAAPPSNVTVELVSGGFESFAPAWNELIAKAITQNVFMDPAMLLAAGVSFAEVPLLALLAWRTCDGVRRLVGACSFAIGRPDRSPLPIRVLNARGFAQGYLASPVLDADHAEDVWRAFLDRVEAEPRLPKIVAFDSMAADDRTMATLQHVLQSRNASHLVFERSDRPALLSSTDPKSYLERAMSPSTRKKLRQHRRNLAKLGTLATAKLTSAAEIARALEEFLQLEAAGWKGRAGTALLSNPADAAFARQGIVALASKRQAWIYALTLDGRAVSMQIVLRAGATAFTWKTAYDENFRDYSPGMLLFEDYTTDLLANPEISFVDSCAHDGSSYMGVWTERRSIADVWIDARRGSSTQFRILSALQQAYRRMRAMAKKQYHRCGRAPAW